MTSRGSEASARASSRNFRWWRFNVGGQRLRTVGEPGELQPAGRLALGCAAVVTARPNIAAIATFSRTVRCAKGRGIW